MMTDAYAIGIDLGGTQVRAGLVDRSGKLIARESMLTDRMGGPQAVVEQIGLLVDKIIVTKPECMIAGIGVSAPGPLDAETGHILEIATLKGWENTPIVEMLEARLGQNVAIENDGLAAALGEWRYGAGKGLTHFVYVTVSTGIGGGVVADGRLLRGRRGMACHVGHMSIDPNGPRCGCGNPGCWEAIASGTALARRAQVAMMGDPASTLHSGPQPIDAGAIFAAARHGDGTALKLVNEEARWLGIGLVNLLHLYSPEKIVLGGGLSQGLDLMRAGIEAEIAAHAMVPFRTVSVVSAGLGGDSGIIGAASLFQFSNRI
jgi:glucokinase